MNDEYHKPLSGLTTTIMGLLMVAALIHVAMTGSLVLVAVTCFAMVMVRLGYHVHTPKDSEAPAIRNIASNRSIDSPENYTRIG